MLAIGLIEDDEKLRKMIVDYFSLQSEYFIAFSTSNIDDIVDAIFPPNIVLLDIHLNGYNNLHRISFIKEIFPEAKIIVMTGEYREEALLDAIKMGASSFINKPFSMKSLIQLINHTLKNGQYLEPKTTGSLFQVLRSNASLDSLIESYELNEKEAGIINLLIARKTYAEIANICQLSISSINTQVRNICVKMGVENKKKLIAKIGVLNS